MEARLYEVRIDLTDKEFDADRPSWFALVAAKDSKFEPAELDCIETERQGYRIGCINRIGDVNTAYLEDSVQKTYKEKGYAVISLTSSW